MNATWISVRDVKVGDRILWGDHRCTVTAVEAPTRDARHRVAVRISVDVPGMPRPARLHYWAHERVRTWDEDSDGERGIEDEAVS